MAGVGETLVSAVVERVCGKLVDFLAEPLDLLWNLEDDIESMKNTLVTIQAVLTDAERRSLRREAESERLWLRRLKSAAYEIDDMFSDFEASFPPKMSRRRDIIRQQAKLFFSSSNPLVSNITLAHSIKNMKEKLDKLVSERRDFDFKVDNGSDKLLEALEIKDRETFSEIDLNHKTQIVGRDDEKKKIVNFLLQQDHEDISTIPIVGLGGLGKTTLAQLAFNDESIEAEFDIRAWVYVSMELNLLTMGKTILSQIDGGGQNCDSLQSVSTCLKSALAGKRFLIVLDDMWEEDGKKLERIKLMLNGGKRGSKVIVTTRSKKVALLMSSKNGMVHYLKGLSDEDCWCIFSQRAFIAGDEGNSALREIGREIIKRCKGVPLAAIALGYILCSKEDTAAWLAVRDSEFWELDDDDVLPSLKLSYYHLPPQLKLCFAYCAIFPKGSDINKDKLIQQWIALELIRETNANFMPEKIGEEYVSMLLGMSFLQYSPSYAENQIMLCMHDLVHDLARSVVAHEMIVLDARKTINRKSVNSDGYYSLLVNLENIEATADYLNFLPDKIRALHFTNCGSILFHNKIFSQKRSLHVLILSGCHVENVPDSVYHLKQLRYLEVSVRGAKSLHESFGNMHNLETLNLSKSLLEELPISINKLGKLKNLCLHGCSLLRILPESFCKLGFLTHLDLSDCSSLQLLPESFGNLSRLHFLQLSGCSELQKLPESLIDLKYLTHLDISGCSSLNVLPEFLGNLSSLQLLYLSGCSELKRLPESLGKIEGLQRLNLSDCRSLQELPESFENLRNLNRIDLSGSELPKLPQFFGHLENLEHLNLSHCYKLHELPECFGNLKSLRILNLSSCILLHNLPESFVSLQNLEKIDLSGCCNLEDFPESIANSDKLQMLDLRGCSKLATTAENFFNSQEMYDFQRLSEIFECKEIGQNGRKCSNIVRLKYLNQMQGKLHITCIENVHSSEEAERAKLCNKSKLHSLTLQWSTCELSEDTKKDELVLEKLQPHRNLELLGLNGYRGTKVPIWVMGLESSLPNLIQITLCNLPHCEQLPPFERLTNLEMLEIDNALKIKGIQTDLQASSGSFRKLKIVLIRDMPNLEEWSITGLTDDIKLERLEIYRCPHIIFRPCLPSAGTSIITESSKILSSVNGVSLSSMSRISKMYIESCSVTSDEWGGLRHYVIKDLEINSCDELYCLPKGTEGLTSLESLTVNNCNRLSILPEWLVEQTSLKSFSISQCSDLKSLRGSFRRLKILSIRDMPNLEEWSFTGSINDIELERLEIYRCPRVIFRPWLPSAETSVINESSMSLSSGSVASPSSNSIFSKMCIENCNMTSDEWGGLGCCVIKDLEIKSCKDLYSLPKGIVQVSSLEKLTINDCNCLSALPEWLGELTSLKSLSISRCLNLKSLPQSILCFTVLENLLVQHCSPELVNLCQIVNKSKIHHVCPRGLVSFVRGEELEGYDLDDIYQASVELLDSDAFGTTYKYQLEKGIALMVRPLREMNITKKEFIIKMRILGAMKHPTLMPLCAYYYGEDEKLLVYDYMPIGSLSLWLHGMKDSGKSSLTWGARSRIALAVAQGLKYIHETSLQWNNIPGVVHGNIKSSNILLCGNNGSPDGAKIFNYGIAQIMGGHADDAYKAPELKDFRRVTQMSDVYSFGVLIMELLTGRNPKSTHIPGWVRQTFHGQWLDVELSRESQMAQQEMMKMMQLAMQCVAYNPERRPTMEVVVHQIEDICELIKDRPDGVSSSIDDSGEGPSTRTDL